jgi:hypothetical protein
VATRSGDSVVYRPTVTEPEALLDHKGGLLLRNRWLCYCRGSWTWEIAEGRGESGTPTWIDWSDSRSNDTLNPEFMGPTRRVVSCG